MRNQVIVIAEKRSAQCMALSRFLAGQFPAAGVHSVSTPGQLREALSAAPNACLVIGADFGAGPEPGLVRVRSVREDFPEIRGLLLLPRTEDIEPWEALLKASSWDFLRRPVNNRELALRVARVLATPNGPSELQQANRVLAGLVEERSHDLYESDERFRLLFNSCSDGLFTVALRQGSGEDRILEVNQQMCHALNYPREEFLSLLPKDLLDPHQIGYVNARLKNLAEQKQMFIETILTARDGQKVPAAITARHFSFTRQPYIVFLVHFRPRGAQGAAGGADLDPVYRTYAMQTGQIMYEYNISDGKIRLTGAAEQITGLSQAELENFDREHWLHLIHTDDRKELLHRLLHATEVMGEYQMQYRVRHASGDYRHVEDLGIVVPDESGAPHRMLGYMRDITDRVRAEQEERLIEQEIQHSKRLESLGVLAGGIAHDFNNILAAIIGLTDMSIQELDGPPDVLEDLQESLRAAHRAKELVKQILAFSRQTGEEHMPVHLHMVVREALGLLRASIPSSVRIVDNVDPNSGMVMANPTQMHQVIMNYCTNGIQAMSEKGGTLEVRLEDVEITRRFAATHPKLHPGPYIKLTVTDKGHGIEPSNMKRIFDPFYTTKGPGEGTGMGLAMVYGIVADHGGAVVVESVLGQGTEFQTYLPRVTSPDHAEPTPAQRGASGGESLLVVDDEQAIRRFCQRSLTQLGYRVHITGEPQVALADFKRAPDTYDLIITDQHMPGMTGDALARRIRKVRPDIPIILFTGFSSEVSDDDVRDAGINEVVPKPILASQLTAAIRRVLDDAK